MITIVIILPIFISSIFYQNYMLLKKIMSAKSIDLSFDLIYITCSHLLSFSKYNINKIIRRTYIISVEFRMNLAKDKKKILIMEFNLELMSFFVLVSKNCFE